MGKLDKIIDLARRYIAAEAALRDAEQQLEGLVGGPAIHEPNRTLALPPMPKNPGGRKLWGPAIQRFLKAAGLKGAKTSEIAGAIGAGTDRDAVQRIGVALQREFKKGRVKRLAPGTWGLGVGRSTKSADRSRCMDCPKPRWSKWPRCQEHQREKWLRDRQRQKGIKPDEHAQALAWAKAHPDDPKAAKIIAIAEQHT
jgi:hypothetical protein